MSDPPKLYTVREAAALLRCHEKTIRRRILARICRATRPAGARRWLIPEAELKRLLNEGVQP